MKHPTTRRALAVITSAAVLASLTAASVASPAAAAKPKCFGRTATIVGTARSETIRGTAKNDVIVAKGGNDVIHGRGGNDIICGNGGNDRLVGAAGNDLLIGGAGRDRHFGGAGRDRSFGGPGNDTFNGGPGNDLCAQGTGSGPRKACERPSLPAPVAPPPPPPPAPPKTLAMAYSDLDGSDSWTSGDVLISKLVDTNGDGTPSAGDTILMGRYPTNLDASTFGEWDVKEHPPVSLVIRADEVILSVRTPGGSHGHEFRWTHEHEGIIDGYFEVANTSIEQTWINDRDSGNRIKTDPGSPSMPAGTLDLPGSGPGDDRLIEVEFDY